MCELASEPPKYSTKDIFERIEEDLGEDRDDDEKITAYVLKQMMLENTGRHLLDSGGMGGRRWERMQLLKDLDWKEAGDINVEVGKYSDGEYYIYLTKNTYIFLLRWICYEREGDASFHAFCESEEHKKDYYYVNMKDYVEYVKEFCSSRGIEFFSYKGCNTYNGDCALDCTLQWEHFNVEGKDYIILQTHNGADVRGGYSTPHLFSVDYESMSCDMNAFLAKCPNWKEESPDGKVQLNLEGQVAKMMPYKHHRSYSDDCGYHWYDDGGCKDWNYTTDEEGNHHAVCPKCGEEIEFVG
jgi:hypothetical protein